jgi:hypothetical protein
MAVHYWFAAYDRERRAWARWEVWQKSGAAPTSWGHVHKNLTDPNAGVGGGPFRVGREWHGEAARDLMRVLTRPEDYPYRNIYRAWPGPNSNTYVAWVLKQAKVAADLDPRAIGKDYCGLMGGGVTTTQLGVQGETPIVGLEIGLREGIEIHALCLTLGLDFAAPAFKSPFGRFGFPVPAGKSRTSPQGSAPPGRN